MIKNIVRELSKHSFIYSLAWFASSFASLVLLPIYTRYLSKADYGILELLELIRDLLNIIIITGIGSAIGKFYNRREITDIEKKSVISTALWYVTISALAWIGLLLYFREYVSQIILGSFKYEYFIIIFGCSMFFEIVMLVGISYLQVEKKSFHFVGYILLRLSLNIFLNLMFIVRYDLGALGMLYGNLITSGVVAVVLTSWCIIQVGLACQFSLLNDMIKFGLPYVPALLFATLMHSADRYIIRQYSSLEDVGLYSLGYKFPFMLNALLLQSFGRIWGASTVYEIAKEEKSREIYSKIATYFITIFIFMQYSLSVLSPSVMTIMVAPKFYEAYRIIPIISLALVFYAMHNFFIIGALIKKKTLFLPFSYGGACIVNIILNLVLVPIYGYKAAAWVSVLTYFTFSAVAYLIFRNIYYIEFEFKRLFGLFILAILMALTCQYIILKSEIYEFGKEMLFIFLMARFLLLGPYFDKGEKKSINENILKFSKKFLSPLNT